MVAIRTGSYAYVLYGYESTYGGSSTVDRAFGLKTSLGTLTLTNNRIDLAKLGQNEISQYAFGQQTGSVSVNYVLADSVVNDLVTDVESAGDIFRAIYGTPSGLGTNASPYLYPTTLGQGQTPKVSESITMNVGFNTSENGIGNNDYKVRALKGCILNNLTLSTAVGDVVNVSADFTFGKEDMTSITYSAPTILCGNPYTFAHAKLSIDTGSGLTEVELVQDTEVSFALNNELLYGLNSHQAVDAYRRILDITGRFKVAWYDWVLFERILAQIGKGSDSNRESTLSGTTGTTELKLEFVQATGGNRIIIELQDIGITDLSVTGIEPVEPVFQEVNYKAKAARVTVVNGE